MARDLCVLCWTDKKIRNRYAKKKAVPGANSVRYMQAPIVDRRPSKPTLAMVGSEDKIQVMLARCAAGQPLFHKADFRPNLD